MELKRKTSTCASRNGDRISITWSLGNGDGRICLTVDSRVNNPPINSAVEIFTKKPKHEGDEPYKCPVCNPDDFCYRGFSITEGSGIFKEFIEHGEKKVWERLEEMFRLWVYGGTNCIDSGNSVS